MLSFEDARQIAITHVGPDCCLVDASIREKPYGWYFAFQSAKYLDTGDPDEMLVGNGGFLVEREGGRVVQFGSAYPAERWLADYEKGFKYEQYDLTICSVSDPDTALDLIAQLGMSYEVAEVEHGVTWRIPKHYKITEIERHLKELPATFRGQRFWRVTDVFSRIDATGCCAYRLEEHKPEQS